MNEKSVALTLLDESSHPHRVPVTVVGIVEDTPKVIKVIDKEEYGIPFTLHLDSFDKIFLYFEKSTLAGSTFSFDHLSTRDNLISLNGIESADLVISGGGPGRPYKTVLKNVVFE